MTTLNFKDIIDLPEWRSLANSPNATAAAVCICSDLRNNTDSHPYLYELVSNTVLNKYHYDNDEWLTLASPALAGTFGAGAACVFVPSAGPRGTLAAGNTTTTVVISTALPSAVGINQLANRGDGLGFAIKIIGNTAGASGRTEIKRIVANTGGTTPTIILDSPLTFTPATGDSYEILSGRVFLLGAGTLAAGIWKFYDIATNSYSANLATANLPGTIATDSALLSLSELLVPHNRRPGEGFLVGAGTYNNGGLNCLTATASASTSITGQATGGDSAVTANEYRNFQIRIVEDSVPTAVGQRRRITSHTAGASPVYTVPTWTVTPSSSAKYVIENDDDKIILTSSGVTTIFNYNITANAWDTTTWAARPGANGAGCSLTQSFSITPDVNKYARHSHIFSIRGGAVSTIDVLDIAGGSTGSWSGAVVYGNLAPTFTTGTSVEQEPFTNGGRYIYINHNGTQRFFRFDMLNRVLEPWCWLKYAQGTAVLGKKLAVACFIEGSTKVAFLFALGNTNALMFNCLIQR